MATILVFWGIVFAFFGLGILPVINRGILLHWESALYGAIMMGWGITLFLIGRIALLRRDTVLIKAILYGIIVWLIVEASFSAYLRVWFNVGVDIAVLGLFSFPPNNRPSFNEGGKSMNPKRFLTIGGVILVTIGFLGVIHLLGRISSMSLFNPPYWINWFHLSLGSFLLVVVFARFTRLQVLMALFGTIVGITIGLLGLLLGRWAANHYNIPELADPSDHLAHLTVGLVAFWAWRNRNSNLHTASTPHSAV